MNYFREIYIENKLALTRNLIYQHELIPKFKSFWGEPLLDILNCNFNINKPFNWVATITRKHRKGFHPIQHILFSEFLDINIADMFNSKEVMEKRNRWLELMMMYPCENKTSIRDKDRAIYIWLHRHDNEWLKINYPNKKVGIRKEQVVDWCKRDEEVLRLFKIAVDSLRNTEEKSERITKTLVAKKINKITLIQRNLNILSMTEEFLNNNIESLEEFQLRCIK
ncbi:TnsD family Tn7-like transposition protein [Clostridium felsineum]|uniref:TnsD family Tn7-like transposition protein n=1 Tax=Clostridium felsineum TaxID=36839 RepID=UPI0009D57A7D|nr:TnsD family Tn7-like transposition protein [Clostridium felsineum]URZ17198.1 hypothetical protein CLFE_032500 [Clostridium felsineum DSM 794]